MITIMSKVKPYPTEITPTFFFDQKYILTFDNILVEQARGHIVLIHENNDFSLKIAALLDGSTIDFLFGARNNSDGKMKAELAKNYIRDQNQDRQMIIANFYYKLYQSIINYYNSIKENNLLTCFGACYFLVNGLKTKLFDNINDGYKPVYVSIYSIKC